MRSWDAIVIGAGPAGALSASMLARAGARTLLVEREQFPRGKLCGGCIASAGQDVLQRQGLADLDSLRNAVRVQRLDLQVGGVRLRVRLPAYRVIDRAELDAEMAGHAVALGAEFRDGVRASVRPGGEVGLEWDGGSEIARAPAVVVCDGIKGSSLRTHGGFGWRVSRRERVGLGGIAARLPSGCAGDAVTMMCGPAGYVGIAPLADGRAVIAAAADPKWLAGHKRVRTGPLDAMLDELAIEGMKDINIRAHAGAPALRRRRDRVETEGKVFVVGDAAGYLEPFTGEGMSWALSSAELAHGFVMQAIAGRYAEGSWCSAQGRGEGKLLCKASAALLRRPRLLRIAAFAISRVSVLQWGVDRTVRVMQGGQAEATA